MLNILASGYFSRESLNILCLILVASPIPLKACATISPEFATKLLPPQDSMYENPAKRPSSQTAITAFPALILSQMYSGVTFRKADGRRIGWDVFTGQYDDNFAELLKDGLKEYWHITSDSELRTYFLDENDYYSVPRPECAPLFTADGVKVVYNEYEIAAYANGRPEFTIPYAEIEDYMMVTAKRLL